MKSETPRGAHVVGSIPLGKVEEVPPSEGAYVQRPRLRAWAGVDGYLGALGYADVARASYEVFRKLKDEGAIPDRLRFQVGLPAPIEPVIGMFTPECLDGVDGKKKDHFVLDSFFEATRQKSQTRSVMPLSTR